MAFYSADEVCSLLALKPHPEGGAYAESYRSPGSFDGDGPFPAGRPYSTAIYFLLRKSERSALHMIKSDELWHFYTGGPLNIAEINSSGELTVTVLGPDLRSGQKLQHVVRAGVWFGAWPADGTDYALVGCTVSPGFDFGDFCLADKAELLRLYPNHSEVINRL